MGSCASIPGPATIVRPATPPAASSGAFASPAAAAGEPSHKLLQSVKETFRRRTTPVPSRAKADRGVALSHHEAARTPQSAMR